MRSFALAGTVALTLVCFANSSGSTQQTTAPKNGGGTAQTFNPCSTNRSLCKYSFVSDASGVASRLIFQSDEDPNFKILIVDISFPPDQRTHDISLQSGAFVHLLDGEGDVTIAGQRVTLSRFERSTVPPGARLQVVNGSNYPVIIRALLVEDK
jgi:quercetin dioxygenase-like cupin family protein